MEDVRLDAGIGQCLSRQFGQPGMVFDEGDAIHSVPRAASAAVLA